MIIHYLGECYFPMKNSEIQQQIVGAAEARFKFYNYQKTTMAEITSVCIESIASNLSLF